MGFACSVTASMFLVVNEGTAKYLLSRMISLGGVANVQRPTGRSHAIAIQRDAQAQEGAECHPQTGWIRRSDFGDRRPSPCVPGFAAGRPYTLFDLDITRGRDRDKSWYSREDKVAHGWNEGIKYDL